MVWRILWSTRSSRAHPPVGLCAQPHGSVGGELNAYTTKARKLRAMPAGNYCRAGADSRLVIDSQFRSRRIDREREVICDEIDSYLDSPGRRSVRSL